MDEEHKRMVRRYALAWRACRTAERNGFAKLEQDMAQGYGMLLCGILVEPQVSPVITADAKDPQFFAAILGNDDSAVPDMTPYATAGAAVRHPRRGNSARLQAARSDDVGFGQWLATTSAQLSQCGRQRV